MISPWNYPLSLIIRPLIGAIAGGNAVIIKPSEVSANMSQAISNIFPKYLDSDAISVVCGGVDETQCLLKEKFDKICYTGSTTVGREIMKAAAAHLTPVLLELGGKSPVIVDKSINLVKAVPRIIWGKFLNSGQTCIAPDYAMVHKDVYIPFLKECVKVIEKFYGEDQQDSKDLGRIINKRHVNRLKQLLKDSQIYYGGKIIESERYISPTIVTNPYLDSPLMNEEIFGPIFPILMINDIEEAISHVNDRPKPLALYIFTDNNSVSDNIIRRTSSGGVCVNETVLHNICNQLPFGGVGDSGIGGYNGKFSFEEFTHRKSVLSRKFFMSDPPLRYPPYTADKLKSLARLKKLGAFIPWLKPIIIFVVFLLISVWFLKKPI
jgi:acyl-CoA reductase-like NAD-dependent aldehyde dehydrogenase